MANARQPGDGAGLPNKPPMAAATANETSTALTVGSIYTGSVTRMDPDGTYVVAVDAPRITITGARLALPALGGLLGFNIKTVLFPGTLVAFCWDRVPFIHSVIPSKEFDWLNSGNRTMVWGADPVAGKDGVIDTHPADMVAGEFEISNGFGIAVAFLTTLCRMSAGGRTAIEMCLLNDMLRLVSSQFRHISGMGDELVFDHGRPTREVCWSSYRHEIMNQLKEGEPYADMKGDDLDRTESLKTRVEGVGRYRWLEFTGFVGDFIHQFVCDPVSTLATMTAEGVSGSGKSWHHVGSDGTLLWQSVSDIRMEIVPCIPVPVRIQSHEHPDITAKRDYNNLKGEYLRLFPAGGPDGKQVYRAAYQIRLYARWLSRLHAVARFLQLSDDYKVPLESDVPPQDPNNAEVDRTAANPDALRITTYACITLMRDGSICLHSGCGGAVVMNHGNIQVSAPRHISLEAAGSIDIIAGDSINLRARRSIEIAAEFGGITMFARAWFKTLVSHGSMWLRSCVDFLAQAADNAPDDAPAPEIAGVPGKRAAVLIEATKGNVISRSEMGFAVVIDGAPARSDDYNDLTYGFAVSAKGNIRMTGGNVIVASTGDIVTTAAKAMALSSPVVYGSTNEFSFPHLSFRSGTLAVTAMSAQVLEANTIFGREIGPLTDPNDPNAEVGSHMNHINVLTKEVPDVPAGRDVSGIHALAFATGSAIRASISPWTNSNDGPLFSFQPPAEYYWDERDEETGVMPQTITQQFLTLDVKDADPWGKYGYGSWTMDAYYAPGPRVGSMSGYGTNRRLFVCETGEALRAASSQTPDARVKAVEDADWVSKSGVAFRFLKRQQ